MPRDPRTPSVNPTRPWLSTEEVAARIGMSADYVRERIEAGDLAAVAWPSGSRVIYRISAADFAAFVARSARSSREG